LKGLYKDDLGVMVSGRKVPDTAFEYAGLDYVITKLSKVQQEQYVHVASVRGNVH